LEEREFKIIAHSIVRFVFVITLLLCSVGFLAKSYLPPPESKMITILQFAIVFILTTYFTHLITLAKARVILTEEGIKHIWERRFILSWEKNFIIPWNLVENYVFHQDRTFDSFIINLKNKRRYKINRLNIFPIRDDFYELVNNFPRLADEYKNFGSKTGRITPSIKHGDSIYSGIAFKVVLYIMAGILLILVATKILNPASQMNWATIGFLGFGVLFYGTMIMQQKRKN
jgi:hypothetical protein